MDAAEKSLFLKFLDTMSVSDKKDTDKKEVESFVSEPVEHIEKLKKRAASLADVSYFEVGDVIIWKDGLKNKRYPNYGQPCIVLSKLNPPIIDDDASYNETLTVKIGFITEEDEFFAFNYDGNRFKKSPL